MDLLSVGKIRLPASMTATSTPKSVIKDANSKPMTPPPMIASDWGNLSSLNISSLDSTVFPSNGKKGKGIGDEPVQINTLLFGINSDSPFSYSTEIVPL